MAHVSLVNVSKIYAESRGAAVTDVSLDVADGEFVVLVGPSGCGKSTTLRMIAGLETISSGTIRIGDRVVNEIPASERDIAMVFQSYALYPHMTVRENLAFALTLRKLPKPVIQERVARAAEILSLAELLDRKPRQLSGGQRQRVAVGRAIVREPQAFLFDEPLSNLDAALRSQMRRELATLHHTLAATMIYVTHDQVEAMTLGDRIVVMKDGKVQQVDTPLRLYEAPVNRFVAGFIGSPSMNFFDAIVDATSGRAMVAGTTESFPLAGRLAVLAQRFHGESVTIGARAEHIVIATDAETEPRYGWVSGRAELVEQMGSETFIHARLVSEGAGTFVCKAPSHSGVRVADVVPFAIDLSQVHCFERATGERVGEARTGD
jgi:multiple sugar transport system ATP-binding protein